MAEEIFIADKKTLDEVNKNSKNILKNTQKLISTNSEQLMFNQYKIFGMKDKYIFAETYSYSEKEIIALESKNGGIFRYLNVEVGPSVSNSDYEYICKNIKIKLIIDGIEYILSEANQLGDSSNLCVKLDISELGTLNSYLQHVSESNLKNYDVPPLYAPDNEFTSIVDKIQTKKFDNLKGTEHVLFEIYTTYERYIKFNKSFKVIVCGESQAYSDCKVRAKIDFLGGIKID
ncbi:hypothetical protein [Clostridium niameyense]|uniref:hypothetical protein n=1 Tax=Clostridium niameyense TaxID=1622073 RepID=UPI00067E69EC|nr:hypothetical protein [Clostridium niameyense]